MDRIPCLVLLLLSWEIPTVAAQNTQTQPCTGTKRCPKSLTDLQQLDYRVYKLAYTQANMKAQMKLMADELRELRGDRECVFGPFGGNGGAEISDFGYSKHGNITGFQMSVIQSRNLISGLAFSYGGVQTAMRGGGPHHILKVVLAPDERITKVEGVERAQDATLDSIWIVSALRFSSNKGKTYGWYGHHAQGKYFRVEGGFLKYVSGKYGGLIDQLNFHFDGCKP